MFGRLFSRKEKGDSKNSEAPAVSYPKVTEPRRLSSNRPHGRPPADADRDFVYYER